MQVSNIQRLFSVITLLLAVLAAGAGCERSYGVMRKAYLPKFPDPDCVRAVIENVPGIRTYREWHWPKEEGQQAPEVIRAHHFAYDGEHATAVQLALFDEGQGQIRFIQAYLDAGRPPQREVDEARHLMAAVEDGLVAMCGLAELRESVRESCSGVECE